MPLLYDRFDRGRLKNIDGRAGPRVRPARNHLPGVQAAIDALRNGTMQVFEVSNVADLVYRSDNWAGGESRGAGRIGIVTEKFPSLVFPFDLYWMEWRIPKAEKEHAAGLWDGLGRVGCWCVRSTPSRRAVDEVLVQSGYAPGPIYVEQMTVGVMLGDRDPTSIATFLLHLDVETGALLVDPGMPDWTVDDGDVITHAERVGLLGGQRDRSTVDRIRTVRTDTDFIHMKERLATIGDLTAREAEVEREVTRLREALTESEADLRTTIAHELRILVLPTLLEAHALLACKNVSTETQRPPEKLSKAHRRRRGNPMVAFKTLVVAPLGQKAGTAPSRVSIGEGLTALHIVRGHRKSYTKDRPLFGKHVGTYFWASHVRGSEEAGVVVKDYEVRSG